MTPQERHADLMRQGFNKRRAPRKAKPDPMIAVLKRIREIQGMEDMLI